MSKQKKMLSKEILINCATEGFLFGAVYTVFIAAITKCDRKQSLGAGIASFAVVTASSIITSCFEQEDASTCAEEEYIDERTEESN